MVEAVSERNRFEQELKRNASLATGSAGVVAVYIVHDDPTQLLGTLLKFPPIAEQQLVCGQKLGGPVKVDCLFG